MPMRRFLRVGGGILVSLGVVLAACSSGGSSPSAVTSATAVASQAAMSEAPSTSPASTLKIGVVTDVGTINDKNFNEYTYKGAQAGAQDLGESSDVPYAVPKDASEYASLIQNFVSQQFDIIVTTGFNLTAETIKAAKANPDIWFIGVDQAPICIDSTGAPATDNCASDPATILPHYVALGFEEDQAGYLAGIVAAAMSKTGTIGAIGGITICAPCVRYIQGYELGAKSYNPNIVVKTAYITTSDFTKAFADPVTGKTFATQFIAANHPDVLFQVAGNTGNGILDAACDANIYAVGVDVDQYLSYPNADKCIITSAEKHLSVAVEDTIKAIAAGTQQAGDAHYDATNDGIGVSDFHDKASLIPSDVQGKLDAALAGMKDGSVVTCPPAPQCGAPPS